MLDCYTCKGFRLAKFALTGVGPIQEYISIANNLASSLTLLSLSSSIDCNFFNNGLIFKTFDPNSLQ